MLAVAIFGGLGTNCDAASCLAPGSGTASTDTGGITLVSSPLLTHLCAVMRTGLDLASSDVARLDAWDIGQHSFFCFPELSVWQAHPFIPYCLPGSGRHAQPHTYLAQGQSGETKRPAESSQRKCVSKFDKKIETDALPSTAVILARPYGASIMPYLEADEDVSVLCIAGGTGITVVLPVLLSLISTPRLASTERKIELVWVV